MKKLLVLLAIAIVSVGIRMYLKSGADDAPQYQTAQIIRGDLTHMVTAPGALNPVLNVQVGCQISGNIQKLLVDFNSVVKEGQVIAQLDPATYEAEVLQAEGDVANARAALGLAELNARRMVELLRQKISPQSDSDTAQAALAQARAVVQMKVASLNRAKVDLSRCTIASPIDGIVISRDVDVGQTVAATMNAPILFKIANDLRKMQIDAAIAEADIGNLEVGQAVDFTVDAFPSRTFRGRVAQVRNAATTIQNVVTYDTVIAVLNDDLKLKPGMTANVAVIIAKREGVLKLPNAALRFRPPESAGALTSMQLTNAPGAGSRGERPPPGAASGDHPRERVSTSRTIHILKGGKTHPAQVKLGNSDGVQTEVLEGLMENDMVVTGLIPKQSAGPAPGGGNPLGGGGRRPF